MDTLIIIMFMIVAKNEDWEYECRVGKEEEDYYFDL